ncbi:hypothetical protein [Lentilactobacillus kribbianus]|uniref:hypothetical protein n=1 Tax=Lentilactobacillus kribbianus TaxID=2729622 RepID=UPI0015573A14|nr:hypothetical protein [Lentilactobacillus kribbianus]
MNFLINVPLSKLTTDADLKLFLERVAIQEYADVTVRLITPTANLAAVQAVATASPLKIMVVDEANPTPLTGDYLLNLRVTDHLLPGALAQLASVLKIHPTMMVSGAKFSIEVDLGTALNNFFEQEDNSLDVRLTAVPLLAKALKKAPFNSLPMADKLAILPMIQRYLVDTHDDRFERMDTKLWPYANVLQISALNPDLPAISVAQQASIMQKSADIVYLSTPIIQADHRILDPKQWVAQLLAVLAGKQQMSFTDKYRDYVVNELEKLKETPAYGALTRDDKQEIQSQIKTAFTVTDGYDPDDVK